MQRHPEKPRDPTQIVGLQLRFREALRSELEEAARASGNSLNAEIVDRLARSLLEDRLLGRGPTRRLMIDLATEIARAEDWARKSWHDDATAYWLARTLADEVLLRSRPRPENFEAIQEEELRLGELRARRNHLIDSLNQYGALRSRMSSVVGHQQQGECASVEPTPEEHWHSPGDTKSTLSEDDRRVILDALEQLRTIENEIELATIVVWELLRPWREARERGLAIHKQLTTACSERDEFP